MRGGEECVNPTKTSQVLARSGATGGPETPLELCILASHLYIIIRVSISPAALWTDDACIHGDTHFFLFLCFPYDDGVQLLSLIIDAQEHGVTNNNISPSNILVDGMDAGAPVVSIFDWGQSVVGEVRFVVLAPAYVYLDYYDSLVRAAAATVGYQAVPCRSLEISDWLLLIWPPEGSTP